MSDETTAPPAVTVQHGQPEPRAVSGEDEACKAYRGTPRVADLAPVEQDQAVERFRRAFREARAAIEEDVAPARDPLRAFAAQMAPSAYLGLSAGEGALHLALDDLARSAIESVYADCGDSSAGVLSTNIGQWIAAALSGPLLALMAGNELAAECVMTRTPPFDFAQCETHDTTFALGATCKFQGRDAWEVFADEADEQRQRAVMAEDAVERATEAAQGARAQALTEAAGLIESYAADPTDPALTAHECADRLRAHAATPTTPAPPHEEEI